MPKPVLLSARTRDKLNAPDRYNLPIAVVDKCSSRTEPYVGAAMLAIL